MRKLHVALASLLVITLARAAAAGPITLSAFSGAATIVDYENLGVSSPMATPLVIAGDTYTNTSNRIRYLENTGSSFGLTQSIIGTDLTGAEFIDITFGTAVLRAGIHVGLSSPWGADVSFYDQSNTLLGVVSLSGGAHTSAFAGWQADSGLIGSIRIQDTTNDPFIIAADNLIKEAAVPEPSTLVGFSLLCIGVLTGKLWRCRRRFAV